MNLEEKMRKLHGEFVAQNGHEPKYVDVIVDWADWDDTCCETIKLRDFDPQNTENDPDDAEIVFYANGIDELCELATESVEDFTIIGVGSFFDELSTIKSNE